MTDSLRQLDAEIDRDLFGHDVRRRGNFFYRGEVLDVWVRENPTRPVDLVAVCHSTRAVVPDYSSDHSAVAQVEAEIARRGLEIEYAEALCVLVFGADEWEDICNDAPKLELDEVFEILRASPELKCRASLAAVRAAEQETV